MVTRVAQFLILPLVAVWPVWVAASSCPGDCSDDRSVSINELIACVNVALETMPASTCAACDGDGDGDVGVDDLIRAVSAALFDCPSELTIRGLCLEPGPSGLVPCAEGTAVDAARCDDRRACLSGDSTVITFGTVGADGRFELRVDSSGVADAPVVFTAQVDPDASYRVIDFGLVGRAAAALLRLPRGSGQGVVEGIVIDPSSEAAVRVLDQNGLENFSDEGATAVIAAVRAANADTDFAGLPAADAATLATDTALQDPTVQAVIESNLHTPTPSPTTPPSTPTPTATHTATATPTTPSNTLVGTWVVLGNPAMTNEPLAIVVFLDGSRYLMMQQGSDPPDPSGHDGFEYGTYSWNPATEAFSAQVLPGADNNGEWGLSHPAGPITIHVEGDQLTYEDTQVTVRATRLSAQPTNPLIGSWTAYANPDEGSGVVVVTFLDGAHFMFAQYAAGGGTPGGYDGIERGTYTWNPSTGAFTALAFQADTNGEWGFSHPNGAWTVSATDTLLTVHDGDGDLSGQRVP